jgi:phosphatidylinositol alpha-mannosyltransferase
MKVGIVCPYVWDVPGGVRSHVADLAQALRDHGHEVDVLAPLDDPATAPEWVSDGGRPIAVSYNGAVARLSFGVKATRRVRAWIREGDFDVVHIHEPLAPSLSLLTCWAARGPLVATWHSSHDRSRILAAGYGIAQTAMEKIRGSIAVSEEARRTLVAHVGGDAVLIPNGVRVSAFRDREPLDGLDPQVPTILFLGRIDEPRKGLSVLVEALPLVVAQVPDLVVLVAGPGDQDEQIAEIPPELLTHIRFLGMVSDEDKARALTASTVYVAPHTGGESFGIVLVEALAASTPVLASDLPAFRKVLEEGRSGRLFPTGDAHALAASLTELLGDDEERAELIAQGNRRVRDFDWDSVVDDVIAVYESVHLPGEKVTEDLRGQIVGRFARLPRRLGGGAPEGEVVLP